MTVQEKQRKVDTQLESNWFTCVWLEFKEVSTQVKYSKLSYKTEEDKNNLQMFSDDVMLLL